MVGDFGEVAMGTVTVTAKMLLGEAVKQSGRRTSVQFPSAFARIQEPGAVSTPLMDLFHRGEVPLKLYLTLVMLTRKPPHEMFRARPDHYWAELLGYEELNDADPIPGKGTRRIKRALAALEKPGENGATWLSRTAVPGHGSLIKVVHSPSPMTAPWIGLPLELWSRGWINVMSARALLAYLCLRLILAGRDDDEGAHVSSWERERFAIKDDTWQRGVKELERLDLARSDTASVATNRWSTDLRTRKVYYLNNTYLKEHDSPQETT